MKMYLLSIFALLSTAIAAFAQNKIVVFQTDFGLKDGAVSAMKGVAMNVDSSLKLFDVTHEIPAYNIWGSCLSVRANGALLACRHCICFGSRSWGRY